MTPSLHIVSTLNKKFALSEEDAQEVFPKLEEAISQKQKLNLSFDGIENCSTIFLNNLLGKLYLSFGENVDKYINFTGIQKDDPVLPERLERLRKRALNPLIYQPIFNNALGGDA